MQLQDKGQDWCVAAGTVCKQESVYSLNKYLRCNFQKFRLPHRWTVLKALTSDRNTFREYAGGAVDMVMKSPLAIEWVLRDCGGWNGN